MIRPHAPHDWDKFGPTATVEGAGELANGGLLEEHRVAELSAWLDAELVVLEDRFRHFWSHRNYRESLGR
jgi:hypothetical protein